ncbi:hypothetical protein DMUE_5047 [Dictyocoela muelleri]|nr:hypothetical protein DMUE_5047 [Dictyocoela muelleri]
MKKGTSIKKKKSIKINNKVKKGTEILNAEQTGLSKNELYSKNIAKYRKEVYLRNISYIKNHSNSFKESKSQICIDSCIYKNKKLPENDQLNFQMKSSTIKNSSSLKMPYQNVDSYFLKSYPSKEFSKNNKPFFKDEQSFLRDEESFLRDEQSFLRDEESITSKSFLGDQSLLMNDCYLKRNSYNKSVNEIHVNNNVYLKNTFCKNNDIYIKNNFYEMNINTSVFNTNSLNDIFKTDNLLLTKNFSSQTNNFQKDCRLWKYDSIDDFDYEKDYLNGIFKNYMNDYDLDKYSKKSNSKNSKIVRLLHKNSNSKDCNSKNCKIENCDSYNSDSDDFSKLDLEIQELIVIEKLNEMYRNKHMR